LDIDSEIMAFFNDEDEQELSALMDVLLKSSGL
jgi:putative methionine-R-sulfoxide reductase with GAF domain